MTTSFSVLGIVAFSPFIMALGTWNFGPWSIEFWPDGGGYLGPRNLEYWPSLLGVLAGYFGPSTQIPLPNDEACFDVKK